MTLDEALARVAELEGEVAELRRSLAYRATHGSALRTLEDLIRTKPATVESLVKKTCRHRVTVYRQLAEIGAVPVAWELFVRSDSRRQMRALYGFGDEMACPPMPAKEKRRRGRKPTKPVVLRPFQPIAPVPRPAYDVTVSGNARTYKMKG